MSESADYYMSWLGCSAFGTSSSRLVSTEIPVVFTPTDISGCRLWYDANNPATITADINDNTSVLVWQNQGSISGYLEPTGGSGTGKTGINTINGLNVINYDVANSMSMINATIEEQPRTFFIVTKCNTDLSVEAFPTVGYIGGLNIGDCQISCSYAVGDYYYQMSSAEVASQLVSNGPNPYLTPLCICFRNSLDIPKNLISINNVSQTLVTSAATGVYNTTTDYLVNYPNPSNQDIAEMIWYGTSLTDEQVLVVSTYLMQKWGIS